MTSAKKIVKSEYTIHTMGQGSREGFLEEAGIKLGLEGWEGLGCWSEQGEGIPGDPKGEVNPK